MARRPTESEFGGTTPTEKQREKTEKPKYKFGDAPKVAKQLFGEKEEGAIEGPKDLSRVREIEQEAAGELAADERRAEVAALGDKAAKKGAKKAEKELSKDVRGLKKETAKAERQDKKGAEEASYSTNKGAEAAVEDVAESVTETVSGGAPATTIKPAGRVEEMSLRQLRERERGAGVGGLLGMGGARGDVRRGIRQGTIHTEEGQESLAELQEAREARQEAQQAKREARAVLRGGEYTPRDPSGFRTLAQDVASRATAAGDVLTEEAAPAPEPRAPEQTGYRAPMDPARIEAGLEQTSPLDEPPRIEEEQFSEDPELALSPLEEEQFSEPAPLDIDGRLLGSTRRAQSFRRELLARGVRGDELEQVADVLSHLPSQVYEGRDADAFLDAARDVLAANPSYIDDVLAMPFTGGTRRAALRALAEDIAMRVPPESA